MRVMKGVLVVAAAMLLLAAVDARAQGSCYSCDPYGSCDISCWYCTELVDPEWGVCPEYAYFETTCGDFLGACTQYGCNPNWVTTDRTTVGQYGESTFSLHCNPLCYPVFGCEHHKVDRVTQEDQNDCNINEAYNTRQFCDDYIDFELPYRPANPPDCCAYPAYCNDWHSCF